jgi:hypothetical protein
MLTLEEFDKIESGTIFQKGITVDTPEGLNLINSGDNLKWIAKKGWADDWCIYAHWAYNSWEFIEDFGDKVIGEENIMNVIPCTQEVFERYRY